MSCESTGRLERGGLSLSAAPCVAGGHARSEPIEDGESVESGVVPMAMLVAQEAGWWREWSMDDARGLSAARLAHPSAEA